MSIHASVNWVMKHLGVGVTIPMHVFFSQVFLDHTHVKSVIKPRWQGTLYLTASTVALSYFCSMITETSPDSAFSLELCELAYKHNHQFTAYFHGILLKTFII